MRTQPFDCHAAFSVLILSWSQLNGAKRIKTSSMQKMWIAHIWSILDPLNKVCTGSESNRFYQCIPTENGGLGTEGTNAIVERVIRS